MWVSIDPEMAWISLMNIQQPDTIWHNVLNYERDPVAQIRVSHRITLYFLFNHRPIYACTFN